MLEVIGALTGFAACSFFLGRIYERGIQAQAHRKAYDKGHHDGAWKAGKQALADEALYRTKLDNAAGIIVWQRDALQREKVKKLLSE